jgi:hypothetical protein
MVHDSYGAHAGHADTLNRLLREAFVAMYRGTCSGQFRERRFQLVAQLTPEAGGEDSATAAVRHAGPRGREGLAVFLRLINPLSQGAYALLDALQGLPKSVQITGAAVLFNEIARGINADPSELLNQAQRRADFVSQSDVITQRTEVRSLRAYVKGELA